MIYNYAPNIGAPKYTKKSTINIKELIDNNRIIIGDLDTLLISMARSSKQKISQDTMALNDTLEQMGLTDIFRTFYSKTTEYTFFESAHETFSRIDHILTHKTSLNKFKKIEVKP